VFVQTPVMQACPGLHAWPHIPQSVLSVFVLAQYGAPPATLGIHFVSAPQLSAHAPALQVSPMPQTWLQVPQFALSVAVLAQ
jgi:hypothetical protein